MSFGRQGPRQEARQEPLPRSVLTALAAACALWLSLGVLGVIGPDTASRIGVLAPAWTLLLLIVLCVGASLWLRRAHASSAGSSAVWLPAAFLSLPWLPLALPAACLLWVGPTAWPIWGAIAGAICGAIWGTTAAAALAPRLRFPWGTDPARAPLIAGVVAAALYLFAGWQVSPWLPAGDEPHYLVIADSLLHDGDLRIENNHRTHQYLRYVDGELKPDFLRRGADGQIYSIHAPGLPVLLLPAYALFGYPGAVACLALLSAAGSALAWRLCFTLTGQPGAAWFGWAVAALPVPALFHAFTIYPDGAGAVLVLTGAAALIDADRLRAPRALLHGAALACLPWLHTRFVLLAAALGLAIVLRLLTRSSRAAAPAPANRQAPTSASADVHAPASGHERQATPLRTIAAFLAVPAASAAAWFAFFYAIYGTPDPSAPYGTYTQSALAHIPAGLTGLLFDQQFGAIASAPVYLVGLCGLAWLALRRERGDDDGDRDGRAQGERRLAFELIATIVPYALAAAMYRMWWGGWSAPARFLAAVLPLLALPAALVWARGRTQATRGSAIVGLGLSVWLSAIVLMANHRRLAYNDRDGFARWADWASPVLDLAAGLPSLFQAPLAGERLSPAFGRAALWLVAIAVTWATLRAIEHARRQLPLAAVTIGHGLAAMVALSACWAAAGVSGLRPAVSQAALLSSIDAEQGAIGVRYAGGSWLPRPSFLRAGALPAALRLDSVTRGLPRERPIYFMPRLPAGRYRLHLQSAGGSQTALEGRLDVYVGRSATPLRSFTLGGTAATGIIGHTSTDGTESADGQPSPANAPPTAALRDPLDLDLPIAVESLSIRGDERARRHVARVTLVPQVAFDPRSRLPPSGNPYDRLPGAAALQTIRYADAAASTVYATSTSIYLEPGGFWIRPRADIVVLIEPERPPTQFAVSVRNGPVENRVRLAVEGWQRDLTLKAGEETTVDVPASRRGATALRLFAAEGFRPSALDPKNGDHRQLGIWVQLP